LLFTFALAAERCSDRIRSTVALNAGTIPPPTPKGMDKPKGDALAGGEIETESPFIGCGLSGGDVG
jgi:hypothetical protein